MDELVRWLGEQLDVDEQVALDTFDIGARAGIRRGAPVPRWVYEADGAIRAEAGTAHVRFTWPDSAAHIVQHDPARVLREINAKRQILAEYEQAARYSGTTWGQSNVHQARARALGKVVRLHALVYADRPGYREEWRP
ncbi:DUF6221 family protein [Streptomyces sp. SRF1]|uniref:DUF6221 family protein n=1 Tax=Streptomyces sp. SRF1 TaxID=1549642 RepID=UPI0025B131AA|nr:DUF6221 family protein [Streptomyces sp. SRF1]MDN3056896.1 DUF6221 family protein [Streptomyces sp. SRF1]